MALPGAPPLREQDENAVKSVLAVLQAELAMVLEVADMERCKWPLLAAARLIATLQHVDGVYPGMGAEVPDAAPQLLDLYQELTSLDPKRQGFYKDMLRTLGEAKQPVEQ